MIKLLYQDGWTYGPFGTTRSVPVFEARRNRLTGTVWKKENDGTWTVPRGWIYFYYNEDGKRIFTYDNALRQ